MGFPLAVPRAVVDQESEPIAPMPKLDSSPNILVPEDLADAAAPGVLSARAALETLPEGILVIAADWRILFANDRVESMVGLGAAEMLGRDYWSVFPRTRGTEIESIYRQAMTARDGGEIEHFSDVAGRWVRHRIFPSEKGITVCISTRAPRSNEDAARRISEERFRLAAANRCITLYEQDRELRYTWLYPLHPEHSHALGRSDHELSSDEQHRLLVEIKRQVMESGRETRREIEVQLSNGTVRNYDLFVSPRRSQAGEVIGVAGAAFDITERKGFEAALRESEQRRRATFENAPAGLAETDLAGLIVSANHRFCTQLGRSKEQLIGQSLKSLMQNPEAATFDLEYQRLMAGGMALLSGDKRLLHRDGSTVWVSLTARLISDLAGRPRFAVVIAEDISVRMRQAAQRELLFRLVAAVNRAGALPEIYEAALDALCQSQDCRRGSILLHDAGGVMRFVAWRGLSDGYRRAVEGHSPWKRDDPDPQPVVVTDVARADLEPALRAVVEAEGIGALAFIPLTAEKKLLGKFMVYFDSPHAIPAEELQVAVTIAHQVGFAIERQQAARALEALVATRTRSLESAVQQLQEFSYTVSHDLRAPVRGMITYVDAIMEEFPGQLTPELRQHLEQVLRNARRMDHLVRDTLAYSRVAREELKLAPVSLDEVVQDSIGSLDRIAQQRTYIDGSLGWVVAHRPSLAQAITNLLINAHKFVRPDLPPRVIVRARATEGRVRLTVDDNGIGIAPANQPKLFRIFERLHPQGTYEGTGIGLAIVKKAIERMDGSVGLASDGTHGSTFWIELPAAAPVAPG